MKLTIVTPLAVIIETDGVVHLRAEDETGAFGILSGHADFLTALAEQGKTHLEFRNIKSSAGSLRPQILQYLSRTFGLNTFIETGTFLGDTSFTASEIFKTVHTIELSPDLYQKAIVRFQNRPHVHVHQGDSSQRFPEILGKFNQDVLFGWMVIIAKGSRLKEMKTHPLSKN